MTKEASARTPFGSGGFRELQLATRAAALLLAYGVAGFVDAPAVADVTAVGALVVGGSTFVPGVPSVA